ncbi:glycosyl hydrolase [Pontibacter sp. H259]|uniref:glycosyl hydrolase n=1 Tax=Pontibacter sp. H259 TaxID=3133421 RepID=UPI0030C02DC6
MYSSGNSISPTVANFTNYRLVLFIVAAAAILTGLYFLYFHNTTAGHTTQSVTRKPIVITKGGTYSGTWESYDSEIPAIDIQTSEPVIIENSTIRSAGYLIKSWGYGVNVTVRNTSGYGLPPTPWRQYMKPRYFLTADVFKNVVVEHCYLENTAGINITVEYQGDGSEEETIKIRYNKVRNIDGRIHNGVESVNFVGLNFKKPIQHAEIAWNEVVNEPDNSIVEDNISIYNTRGTPGSPIKVHNNYIQGAYPFPASANDYSGGGIMAESPKTDSTRATAYVEIYQNQLVGLGNYCISVAGGNNIKVYDNTAIVAGVFEDGKRYKFWTSGIWIKDLYNMKSTYKVQVENNKLAVVGKNGGWRNEFLDSLKTKNQAPLNHFLKGEVTKTLEKNEYRTWQQKLEQQEIKPGPFKS